MIDLCCWQCGSCDELDFPVILIVYTCHFLLSLKFKPQDNNNNSNNMPATVLSPRRRSKIAALAPFKSQRSIADMFNVSQRTVSYCIASSKAAAAVPVSLDVQEQPLPFTRL